MILTSTTIAGMVIVDLEPRSDERGTFARAWCANEFEEAGLQFTPVQANMATSTVRGTMRGLHVQTPPVSEQKLVRCTAGSVFDVVVDLRPESVTYLAWEGVELSAANARSVLVPARCAHGYLTLADDSTLLYLVDQAYSPGGERGLRFDDATLRIEWPGEVRSISGKDLEWSAFESARSTWQSEMSS